MSPELTISIMGTIVALLGALVRLTWILARRLGTLELQIKLLEARLEELTTQLGLAGKNAAEIGAIRERLAVLEAEHERAMGPGGLCHRGGAG